MRDWIAAAKAWRVDRRRLVSRSRPMRIVLAGLLAAGVSVSATALAGAAPAARPPGWQTVPGVRADLGTGLVALSWASNRVWLAATATGPSDTMSVTSATIAGPRLVAFKTSRYRVSPYVRLVLGTELVYSLPGTDASQLQMRQLLASGGLGPPSAVPLNTKTFAPNQAISPQAAIRVGDRTVWALPGTTRPSSASGALWVCCASDGSARNLTRFIVPDGPPSPVRLGLDKRGRLWLAWHDRGSVKLLELDPSSLLPRSSKAIVAPGSGVERFDLACDVVCRLVIENIRTGIHSWWPGERSRTRIARTSRVPRTYAEPRLLAAAYRSGRLVVAYSGVGSGGLRVVRGNARGARPRVVGKAAHLSVGVLTHAVFVPAGLIVVTPKNPDSPSAVLIRLIRVAR